MLSPKARNLVFEIRGVGVMATLKLHVEVRARESVAVHVTTVLPSGKLAPDCVEQVTVTGDWPPEAVGTVNDTGIATLSGDSSETDAGHETVGAAGGGGGGVGPEPHAAAVVRPTTRKNSLGDINGEGKYQTRPFTAIRMGVSRTQPMNFSLTAQLTTRSSRSPEAGWPRFVMREWSPLSTR